MNTGRSVYLVRGSSAAGCLRLALGHSSSALVYFDNDDLAVGPLGAASDLPSWQARRRDYWRSDAAPFDEPPGAWSADSLRNVEELTVVCAEGLGEQLLLALARHLL